MSTIALYRKWRPKTFSEVVGQDHIVQSLRNSIIDHHIAHAYLFCGTRGTGKTSLAKIFAKAINCINPQNGDPCGVCEMCQDIQNGTAMDIIEMDAASNNSVDHIRKITEEVYFLPAKATYKVYIIDEFHMLTGSAFNALLKTLEEPPAHIVFILATTETHRIPATILSRCQRYDFHRIPVHFIKEQLTCIAKAEQININHSGLEEIAYLSDGALRDAISLLDQCHLAIQDQIITETTVQQLTGRTDKTELGNICIALINGDVNQLLNLLQSYIQKGKHINQLIDHLLAYTRDIMIVNQIKDPTHFVHLNENEFHQMKQLANQISLSHLVLIANQMVELKKEVKWAENKKTVLELYLLKLMQNLNEQQMLQAEKINQTEIKPLSKISSVSETNMTNDLQLDTSSICNSPKSTHSLDLANHVSQHNQSHQDCIKDNMSVNLSSEASFEQPKSTKIPPLSFEESTIMPSSNQTHNTTITPSNTDILIEKKDDEDSSIKKKIENENIQNTTTKLSKIKKEEIITSTSPLWVKTLTYLKENNPFIYCILSNISVSGTTKHVELSLPHVDEADYTFLKERKNEKILKDALKKANDEKSVKLTIHISDPVSNEENELDWINELKEKAKIIGVSIEEKGE